MIQYCLISGLFCGSVIYTRNSCEMMMENSNVTPFKFKERYKVARVPPSPAELIGIVKDNLSQLLDSRKEFQHVWQIALVDTRISDYLALCDIMSKELPPTHRNGFRDWVAELKQDIRTEEAFKEGYSFDD